MKTEDHRERFLIKTEAALDLLEAQLKLTPEARSESIHDGLIRQMIGLLEERRNAVIFDKIPPKSLRYDSIRRIILDSWPLRSEFGRILGEIEDNYRELD